MIVMARRLGVCLVGGVVYLFSLKIFLIEMVILDDFYYLSIKTYLVRYSLK